MTFSNHILVGNVGRSPELRYTPQGSAVCDFSLAVNSGYGDKQSTVWFKITCWAALAETMTEHLTKGSRILVTGDRLEVEAYTSKDNEPRATMNLTARDIRFLDNSKSTRQEIIDAPSQEYTDNHEGDVPF